MADGGFLLQQLRPADDLVHAPVAHRSEDFPDIVGDEEEVVDHMLGRALEALAQHRILGGNADRARVEVALAHHDAAGGDQRRSREAEFIGAEQGPDDDVATGLEATIDLQRHAAAQAVQHQRLLGFGQADFPGTAGMLERGERRGTRATIIARHGDVVGARLGDAGILDQQGDFGGFVGVMFLSTA